MVIVKIGPEGAIFKFHRGLLCRESTYFKAAMEGGFMEALDQSAVLEDEDPEVGIFGYLWTIIAIDGLFSRHTSHACVSAYRICS